MCGICGFTGHRNDQKAVIERMMKSIEHRGPDSEGSFCGGEITLGFRRLSIIDLEDGQQPMESADGNLQIVFNGEIYDYKELRAELEAAGISFSHPFRYGSAGEYHSEVRGKGLGQAAGNVRICCVE